MKTLPRPFRSLPLIAVLVLLSCASRTARAQELGSDVLGKIKAATVFVKAKEGTGTGFLFLKVGGTAYLMTCEHVVHGSETVEVVFNSGTRNEHSYRATTGVSDSDRDLACLVLKDAADLPEPLTLLDKTTVVETQTVYVAGFPFGDGLSASSRSPEVSVTRVSVSSIRRGDREEVVAVQLSGDVNPGNSGGPVVDQRGSVIGVVQSKIEATQMAFAIPPESLGDFLDRCLSSKGGSTTAEPTPGPSPATPGPSPTTPEPSPKRPPALVVWLDTAKTVKMDLVRITAGKFMMGSNDGRVDEMPVHEVTLTKDYWMGATEVTQRQWVAVMGANPSNFEGMDLPVEQVSWEDCKTFLGKLNEKVKEQIVGKVFGLPTEAEWEYACRAAGTGKWCYGDDESKLAEYAWYEKNSRHKTHSVGGKKSNGWGLYDMHGNVWEWCEDGYTVYAEGPVTDPKGPASGASRLWRGGSWCGSAAGTRSAYRSGDEPAYRIFTVGFRAVLR